MKRVRNVKEWTPYGEWFYRMQRTVGTKVYQHNLVISKYEMHQRQVVAWKLRDARKALRDHIAHDLPQFTFSA